MAGQLPRRPQTIFEVINENVNIMNQNVLDLMEKVTNIEQEVIALKLMFDIPVPEKPIVPGDEGAGNGVNREQAKQS